MSPVRSLAPLCKLIRLSKAYQLEGPLLRTHPALVQILVMKYNTPKILLQTNLKSALSNFVTSIMPPKGATIDACHPLSHLFTRKMTSNPAPRCRDLTLHYQGPPEQ
jgi:hypothetical protein